MSAQPLELLYAADKEADHGSIFVTPREKESPMIKVEDSPFLRDKEEGLVDRKSDRKIMLNQESKLEASAAGVNVKSSKLLPTQN